VTAEEKTRVTVNIYGVQYRLMGNSSTPTTHLQMVAAQVDEQMRKIAQGQPHLDMPRIAVLTAVNFADEMSKLDKQQTEINRLNQDLESKREQLTEGKKQRENLQQELQLLREEHRDLQKEYKQVLSRGKTEDDKDREVHTDYAKLKEEYRKLQTEYNEWIQLIERDDPGSK
jgi:cell division protein ZapA (FtsZ GTPase activity inhibitor)